MSVLRVLSLIRGYLPRVALAGLVAALGELAGIALIATATWLLATAAEQPPLTSLTVAIVAVRAFAIGRGLLRYLDRLVGHDAVLRALARLRGIVFKALTPLAPTGARLFRGGDLLTRLVTDVDAVQDLLLRIIVPVWTAVIVAAAMVGFTAVFAPGAAWIIIAGVLLSGVVLPLLAGLIAKKSARRTVTSRAALAASTVDLIHGSADLAAYGATDDAVRRGERDAATVASSERRGYGVVAAVSAAQGLVAGACVIAILWSANGLGVMTAVLALTALVGFEVLSPLPQAARRLAEVTSATDRLVEVLDAAAPVADPQRPAQLPAGPAHLELVNAVAAKPKRANEIGTALPESESAGISLDLPSGKRVAIVGASGAGKTMLLSMLVRFTGVERGRVLLDGVDVSSLPGDEVRDVIGGMLSDAYLFNATVKDNLLLADDSADDEQLRATLARAGLADLDLSTVVGEDGRMLSGGQRQRLLLARALLGGHSILLLDEPTEHLDALTAEGVMTDLLSSTDGRSLILVTHHLAHMDSFDEILVLDSAAVVQRGTHAELLRTPGPYREFAGTFARAEATIQP